MKGAGCRNCIYSQVELGPLPSPWPVRAFKHWADPAAVWQVQERKGFEPEETQNRGGGAGELLLPVEALEETLSALTEKLLEFYQELARASLGNYTPLGTKLPFGHGWFEFICRSQCGPCMIFRKSRYLLILPAQLQLQSSLSALIITWAAVSKLVLLSNIRIAN